MQIWYGSTSWQISVYVVKIYILFPYCNVIEIELIFQLTAFPLSKFLFARSTLEWILVVMGELANGTGICKSISRSHILHTVWNRISQDVRYVFQFTYSWIIFSNYITYKKDKKLLKLPGYAHAKPKNVVLIDCFKGKSMCTSKHW